MKNKKIKSYIRICGRCGSQHKIIKTNGIRPYSGAICSKCKTKSQNKRTEDFLNKNKKDWENLILSGLKKDEKLFEAELARRLGCTCFSMRKRLRALSKEGKIKISKRVTVRLA